MSCHRLSRPCDLSPNNHCRDDGFFLVPTLQCGNAYRSCLGSYGMGFPRRSVGTRKILDQKTSFPMTIFFSKRVRLNLCRRGLQPRPTEGSTMGIYGVVIIREAYPTEPPASSNRRAVWAAFPRRAWECNALAEITLLLNP